MPPWGGMLLAAVFLLTAARPAAGQTILNVEAMGAETATGAHLALEGGADVRGGNEEVIDLHGGAAIGYRWPRHWLRLLGGAEQLEEEGEDLVSSRFLHLRYNRIFGPRWRSFHFVQLQANRALLLDRRVLLGSGLRANVLTRGRHRLDLGSGLMAEDERLDPDSLPAGAATRSRTVRATNLVVYRLAVREKIEWLSVTYYQPRASRPQDYRLLHDLSFEVALAERVALESRLEFRHDSRPPPGVERRDVALTTAIRFSFP